MGRVKLEFTFSFPVPVVQYIKQHFVVIIVVIIDVNFDPKAFISPIIFYSISRQTKT